MSSENMNSSVGLVADGVRCGDRHVCERGRCSPLPALTTSSPCPRDALGRTCSAHGVSLFSVVDLFLIKCLVVKNCLLLYILY